MDTTGYFKDVVTPFELDLALDRCVTVSLLRSVCKCAEWSCSVVFCSDKEWTGAYSTDFHTILTPSDANAKKVCALPSSARMCSVC
jgi:hypothetical protein